MLLGRILQVVSFHETEWLVHSPARASLGIEQPFRDDTLAYFTERLDPAVTGRALARLIRQAKRNKAFQDSPRIGLALDGTTVGRTRKRPCPLCHPLREKQGRARGSLHKLVMGSVVGAGLSLPVDVEPYGPAGACCAVRCSSLVHALPTMWWQTRPSLERLSWRRPGSASTIVLRIWCSRRAASASSSVPTTSTPGRACPGQPCG